MPCGGCLRTACTFCLRLFEKVLLFTKDCLFKGLIVGIFELRWLLPHASVPELPGCMKHFAVFSILQSFIPNNTLTYHFMPYIYRIDTLQLNVSKCVGCNH